MPFSAFVTWPALHAFGWATAFVLTGIATFNDVPAVLALGGAVGLVHTVIQWLTTSAVVGRHDIETRNLVWTRRIAIDDISEIHRVGRRAWQAAQLTLADGTSILLPVPVASMITPNPRFDTQMAELCASVAYRAPGAGPV